MRDAWDESNRSRLKAHKERSTEEHHIKVAQQKNKRKAQEAADRKQRAEEQRG